MQLSNKQHFFSLLLLSTALLFLQACGDDGPTQVELTPPKPYSLLNADTSYTTKSGLEVYVIKSSDSPFKVNSRDQIQAKYTGRTNDGRVFDSTFRNDNESPRVLRNLTSTVFRGSSGQPVNTLVEGFRKGIVGITDSDDNTEIPAMREGEKRKIVMPPELGYKNARENSQGYDLRNDTLRFDIEVVRI